MIVEIEFNSKSGLLKGWNCHKFVYANDKNIGLSLAINITAEEEGWMLKLILVKHIYVSIFLDQMIMFLFFFFLECMSHPFTFCNRQLQT